MILLRRSLRILSVAEGEPLLAKPGSCSGPSRDDAASPTLRSRSVLGCMKQSSTGSFVKVFVQL
jgi:hypothetical protein